MKRSRTAGGFVRPLIRTASGVLVAACASMVGPAPSAAQGRLLTFRAGASMLRQASHLYSVAPAVSWRPDILTGERFGLFGELGATGARNRLTGGTTIVEVGVGASMRFGPIRAELEVGSHCWMDAPGLDACPFIPPQPALVWQRYRADGSTPLFRGLGIRYTYGVDLDGEGALPYSVIMAFAEFVI